MAELLSVGLDVGTTTTQLIASRLTVENRASGFAVPHLEIAQRQVIYESAVHFTPLIGENLVDGEGVRAILEQEYQKAGITAEMVDTGAVIITGETSRRENARAVLHALSQVAGDFVVATAGPSLESVLAAKGAGAAAYSQKTGKTVLHMDIGGGTANLAYIADGKITATGCMNVGGRLVKIADGGKVSYVSPVVQRLTDLRPGEYPAPGQLEGLAKILACGLEMAAGLRPATELFHNLWTQEAGDPWQPRRAEVISFSGGVADCIEAEHYPGEFGDMGTQLGQAIKESLLCQGDYRLGEATIRATVIGAGCHSARLSGSTVFCRGVDLPVKNLPVAVFTKAEQESPRLAETIRQRLLGFDAERVAICLPGCGSYGDICRLAEALKAALGEKPIIAALQTDCAKALGQKLMLLGCEKVVCIDGVPLESESFLDIGQPVGPAFPVVVKTLVLREENS